MGAWGYGALDSDAALDWIGPVLDDVADQINKLLAQIEGGGYYDEGELRASAHLFCTANVDFHAGRRTNANETRKSTRQRLIDALTAHRNSDQMDDWDNPEKARLEIDKEIARLRDPEGHGQPRSTTLMDNL